MLCLSIDITGAINDVHFLSVVPKQDNFRFFIFGFVSLLRYTVIHRKYLFLNRPILLVSVLLKWVSSMAPGKLDQKLDLSFLFH